MDDKSPLPNKDDVAKVLLQKGSVFLHLDPRNKGVLVPNWLKEQHQLVLQIGYDMPVAIPDLLVDGDGISATLSFNRTPFACWVPWDSIFALIGEDGRGMVWASDMPVEIAAEIDRETQHKKTRVPSQKNESDSSPPSSPSKSSISYRNKRKVQEYTVQKTSNKVAKIPFLEVVPQPAKTDVEINPQQNHRDFCSSSGISGSEMCFATGTQQKGKKDRRKPVKLPPYLRVIK